MLAGVAFSSHQHFLLTPDTCDRVSVGRSRRPRGGVGRGSESTLRDRAAFTVARGGDGGCPHAQRGLPGLCAYPEKEASPPSLALVRDSKGRNGDAEGAPASAVLWGTPASPWRGLSEGAGGEALSPGPFTEGPWQAPSQACAAGRGPS